MAQLPAGATPKVRCCPGTTLQHLQCAVYFGFHALKRQAFRALSPTTCMTDVFETYNEVTGHAIHRRHSPTANATRSPSHWETR